MKLVCLSAAFFHPEFHTPLFSPSLFEGRAVSWGIETSSTPLPPLFSTYPSPTKRCLFFLNIQHHQPPPPPPSAPIHPPSKRYLSLFLQSPISNPQYPIPNTPSPSLRPLTVVCPIPSTTDPECTSPGGFRPFQNYPNFHNPES